MKPKFFKYSLILLCLLFLSSLFVENAGAQFNQQNQRRGSFSGPSKTSQSSQTTAGRSSATYFSQTQSVETKNVPAAQNIKEVGQKVQTLINSQSPDSKKVSERIDDLTEERKNMLWARYVEPGNSANAYGDAGGGKAGQNAQRAFELWSQGYSVKNVELHGGYILDVESGRITNREGQDVTAVFLKDLSKNVQITRITFDNGEIVGGYNTSASEMLFYVELLMQGSPQKAVETLLIDSNGRPVKLSQRKESKKQSVKKGSAAKRRYWARWNKKRLLKPKVLSQKSAALRPGKTSKEWTTPPLQPSK